MAPSLAKLLWEMKDDRFETFLTLNAGHSPEYLLSHGRGTLLASGGPSMGVSHVTYEEEELLLTPKDSRIVDTDELTETWSETGERFGEERLLKLLCDEQRRTRCLSRGRTSPVTRRLRMTGALRCFFTGEKGGS